MQASKRQRHRAFGVGLYNGAQRKIRRLCVVNFDPPQSNLGNCYGREASHCAMYGTRRTSLEYFEARYVFSYDDASIAI